MTTTNTNRIPSGTKVILPDGTVAVAYPDIRIGQPWNHSDYRYKTYQGGRCDHGWTREQLTVVG